MRTDEWTLRLEREGYSQRTIRSYQRTVLRADEWLTDHNRPPVERATWKDLRDYGDSLPNTYASRAALRSALASYLRALGHSDPPTWGVLQPKKPDPVCKALDRADLERVMAAAHDEGPMVYASFCLLYYQSLRRDEAARCRWDDFDSDGWMRIVGKGNREARLPVHAKLASALESLVPRCPWVLPGRSPGTHVSAATINLWARIVGARAGLHRLTPHVLRHTGIAAFHDATSDMRAAMTYARHRSTRTTQIYTRTLPGQLRKGMDAL